MEILDDQFNEVKPRRRSLLPWWIKVFIWLFLNMGAIAPLGLILGSLDYSFNSSLFGLETNDPLSPVGMFLMTIMTIKGIAAFGLWWEKDWAILVAHMDAYLSIAVCVGVMGYALVDPNFGFKLRLELLLLLPYLLKLNDIKKSW